jgi:hypothetical protein
VDTKDLIDQVWPASERAKEPNTEIYIHDLNYAGLNLTEKIKLVQAKIVEAKADIYVVTALDDVACKLSCFRISSVFGLIYKNIFLL